MIGYPSTRPYSGWCCFDHLTIFVAQNTRRLSISRNAFPVNFYHIRVNKYKHMRVLKNKREIQNYKKLRVIGLFCYMWFFFGVTGVCFPEVKSTLRTWEGCNHGMNNERKNGHRQPGVIMCDILLHHSLPFLPNINLKKGTGRGGGGDEG